MTDAEPADIPVGWYKVTKEEARENLKNIFHKV